MKKILSLDGGGIRGIIPARVLQAIETELETDTAEIFDLIAGTSTGGILALGLSKAGGGGRQPQYSAGALAEIYDARGAEIFDPTAKESHTPLGTLTRLTRDILPMIGAMTSDNSRLSDSVRHIEEVLPHIEGLSDEKYSHAGLVNVLDHYLGKARLGDTRPDIKVMVTCYDIQARCSVFLKNWHPTHRSVPMTDAARATAAAPTYFEPVDLQIGTNRCVLVDGRIFVNAPIVSAYAEAKRIFPDEKDFFVLSLGTGTFSRLFRYIGQKP